MAGFQFGVSSLGISNESPSSSGLSLPVAVAAIQQGLKCAYHDHRNSSTSTQLDFMGSDWFGWLGSLMDQPLYEAADERQGCGLRSISAVRQSTAIERGLLVACSVCDNQIPNRPLIRLVDSREFECMPISMSRTSLSEIQKLPPLPERPHPIALRFRARTKMRWAWAREMM